MNACPDWTAVVAHRFERDGEEPAGWRGMLAHAEECADCRRQALAADPTLVFARLAAEDSAVVDVAAMRRAVETLRRAQRVSPGRARRGRAGGARWRLAAAAVLPLLTVLLPASPRRQSPPTPVARIATPAASSPSFAELAALPLVEDLGRPDARVYQLGGPDLAVVMIVDETLDV